MNYIFFTGAPGSKWSSVVKNIYWSNSIDQSDYSQNRLYWHDADTPGTAQLMHLGAYWDPGMEFGNQWQRFNEFDKQQLEREFDLPFKDKQSKLKRIVKSHVFAHHLDRLANYWKDSPIVLVYRNNIECYQWWKLCGEFSITYPLYNDYYIDLSHMWHEISQQNSDIMNFVYQYRDKIHRVENNEQLCDQLSIDTPKDFVNHNYKQKDIQVYVYK